MNSMKKKYYLAGIDQNYQQVNKLNNFLTPENNLFISNCL